MSEVPKKPATLSLTRPRLGSMALARAPPPVGAPILPVPPPRPRGDLPGPSPLSQTMNAAMQYPVRIVRQSHTVARKVQDVNQHIPSRLEHSIQATAELKEVRQSLERAEYRAVQKMRLYQQIYRAMIDENFTIDIPTGPAQRTLDKLAVVERALHIATELLKPLLRELEVSRQEAQILSEHTSKFPTADDLGSMQTEWSNADDNVICDMVKNLMNGDKE